VLTVDLNLIFRLPKTSLKLMTSSVMFRLT